MLRLSLGVTSSYVYMFIRKDSRYTEKDAAVVVRQMLKVAAECHLRGLVHRDMKPEVGMGFDLMPQSFRFMVKESEFSFPFTIFHYRTFCSNQQKKFHL